MKKAKQCLWLSAIDTLNTINSRGSVCELNLRNVRNPLCGDVIYVHLKKRQFITLSTEVFIPCHDLFDFTDIPSMIVSLMVFHSDFIEAHNIYVVKEHLPKAATITLELPEGAFFE
jgi:hypothetical protein